MGTQKTYIPNLMETVLWDQSFKCTSQHGPKYLKVVLNLGLSLPMPLFFPLVILTCHTEILRFGKMSKVLLRCFCKGSFSSSLELSRKEFAELAISNYSTAADVQNPSILTDQSALVTCPPQIHIPVFT